ncbi:MAG: glycosyltransferase family 4 protein [Sedimenticola sp.]|nr:glycosyltransferase family 4 protein [Sedimenticola sp.]
MTSENPLEILFLSPVVPRKEGHGASMRACLNLEALSSEFKVHLVVLSIDDANLDIPDEIKDICSSSQTIFVANIAPIKMDSNFSLVREYFRPNARLIREYPPSLAALIYRNIKSDLQITLIHCFRLCLLDVSVSLGSLLKLPLSSIVLDVDDFESRAATRTAFANKQKLGNLRYLLDKREINRICKIEKFASNNCGQLLLCSVNDKEGFLEEYPNAKVSVVANGYRFTNALDSNTSKNTLVFVGSLGYQPNKDALYYFFSEIWPKLVQLRNSDVQLVVAGRSPPSDIVLLCQQARVTLLENPTDIRFAYKDAVALIVPLRMGGGTRIKILEALGFGRCVISTSIGAEGLDLVHNEHLLLADTAVEFAQACNIILSNPVLSKRLVCAGRTKVRSLYSPDSIKKQILDAYSRLSLFSDAIGH